MTETATASTETAAKPATRTELLAQLKVRNYTGPTSFTASTLRVVVAWLEAGSPQAADVVPVGVFYSVHPDLKSKAAAKAR